MLSVNWLLRFVQGMVIGTGFLLPGVSGGALAAVFGLYERMIAFLAHLTRDFCRNLLFFLPVGLGAACGCFLLSFALSYLLHAWEMQMLWLFVGCILGTLPALWRRAGQQGRYPLHVAILLLATVLGYAAMAWGVSATGGLALPNHPATWLLAGGILGLGVIVPGLSPSNLLVYLGLYPLLADSIRRMELAVLLPLVLGAVACVLLLSRLADAVFARAYTGVSHAILGIVLASTVMIVPIGNRYTPLSLLGCAAACVAGALLGGWMCQLETKKPGLQNQKFVVQ